MSIRHNRAVSLLGESQVIEGDEWVKVKVEGGGEGWVSSKFLSNEIVGSTPTPYGSNSPFFGTWRGEFQGQSNSNTYVLIWEIGRDGDKIRGTIHAQLKTDPSVYSDSSMVGLISGDSLTYIERDPTVSSGSSWCLTNGTLRMDGKDIAATLTNQPGQHGCTAQPYTIRMIRQ
jgi:hypothetical protein